MEIKIKQMEETFGSNFSSFTFSFQNKSCACICWMHPCIRFACLETWTNNNNPAKDPAERELRRAKNLDEIKQEENLIFQHRRYEMWVSLQSEITILTQNKKHLWPFNRHSLSQNFYSVWQHCKDRKLAKSQAGSCRSELSKDELEIKTKSSSFCSKYVEHNCPLWGIEWLRRQS